MVSRTTHLLNLFLLPTLLVFFQHRHWYYCNAFLTRPPSRFYGRNGNNNNEGDGGGGFNNKPPHHNSHQQPDWGPDDSGGGGQPTLVALRRSSTSENVPHDDDDEDDDDDNTIANTSTSNVIRGGASRAGSKNNKNNNNNNVIKGTKATLATTTSFWSDAFSKAGQVITSPFRAMKLKVTSAMESDKQKAEKELLKQLQTTKVVAVTLPNTTVVPREVIQLAARRSGLIGNPLRTDRVQEFAASLKRWYQMRGYVLHEVTGATLRTESATAEIQVEEPKVNSLRPVDIVFCKEMVVDEETGNLLTFRQYKERHTKRRTVGHKAITKADTNTTFVQTTGKTRPGRIATALGLQPGRHFQWDANKWNMIRSSGIFGRILRAGPRRMQDGTVQFEILATEAPPRHLEYGVAKSLYTGSWEGEVDFQHENLFGAGESLGLMVRRGTKDPEPSVRVRFSDDKFGMPGGYDVEAFSDFIGDDDDTQTAVAKDRGGKGGGKEKTKESSSESNPTKPKDPDRMLDRRGVKFTYRNPIDPNKIRFSTASTSLERTATASGIREAIGYGTLALGPFRQQLPREARSSFDGSVTTGLRIPERSSQTQTETEECSSVSGSSFRGITLMPYSSCTLTTTQILPLLASSSTSGSREQPSLALRHSLRASTRNLPRHEKNAIGFSSMIRGGTPHGRISTSVTSCTELRIPLQLGTGVPALNKLQQDASFVLFGDWVSTRKSNGSPFVYEKSIGIGVRKITQGIPLKVDFSYAGNGKIKSSFGLGRDFDA